MMEFLTAVAKKCQTRFAAMKCGYIECKERPVFPEQGVVAKKKPA
jgi:hypothetical protein